MAQHTGKYILFKLIPTRFLSRIFGYVTRIHPPRKMLEAIIRWYCRSYGVNTDEINYPEDGFSTFNEFFTRKLLPGTHTIDPDTKSIVSPVDGRVDQFGSVSGESLLQAKGIEYSLRDLLPGGRHVKFIDGNFITLYLSPADYHRIHSPVSGTVDAFQVIPGALYTVQEWLVRRMPGLFSINERLVSYIHTGKGKVAVCKVGALNVGRISLSYADVLSNRSMLRRFREHEYTEGMGPVLAKGDELGIFHLGSTVIVLFEKGMMDIAGITSGQKIRMGEMMGHYR
ncbi:MAG: archaetidylserine decarboxylase [Spirochaetota bacterium]